MHAWKLNSIRIYTCNLIKKVKKWILWSPCTMKVKFFGRKCVYISFKWFLPAQNVRKSTLKNFQKRSLPCQSRKWTFMSKQSSEWVKYRVEMSGMRYAIEKDSNLMPYIQWMRCSKIRKVGSCVYRLIIYRLV